MRIGAIEAGGTKFVCGYGNEDGFIEDRISLPTGQPDQTLDEVIAYFQDKRVDCIGIGTFGPINIDPASPLYGYVTTTPKEGWARYPFLKKLKKEFHVPFGWDTDVNAAALGEATWGAAKGSDSCVYFTIGTGIGIGVYTEGKLVHGLVHPEGGHLLIRRHPHDEFVGSCPYHGDCLEGMASGPAIEKRWNIKGSDLGTNHSAWDIEAFYIGQAVTSAILMLSPKKIILGGGVMHQKQLFPLIRTEVQKNLNGYVSSEALLSDIDHYIIPPGLEDNAGLCGAMALGLQAFIQREIDE
ncbi:ROK family protein [Alicyclobacillus fastidiosus]|uniref:fructokinase n=1 Tax=Alicyclobacillus fastidiosus TaxID=392011 RepID=A0ABV5AAS6_9BACL|nr:ROK family protein [Alicyclobacillus fastidiosus]WEH11934.1 ROK family protein [Alicyclobacillus fastidiosus]